MQVEIRRTRRQVVVPPASRFSAEAKAKAAAEEAAEAEKRAQEAAAQAQAAQAEMEARAQAEAAVQAEKAKQEAAAQAQAQAVQDGPMLRRLKHRPSLRAKKRKSKKLLPTGCRCAARAGRQCGRATIA